MLWGDCSFVSHSDSGETIWRDDGVHSLMVEHILNKILYNEFNGCTKTALGYVGSANNVYFIEKLKQDLAILINQEPQFVIKNRHLYTYISISFP